LLRSTSGFNESSLLHLAVESGSVEAVVFFLQLGIDKRIIVGTFPLHAGISMMNLTFQDSGGCTALHSACRMGHLPLIRLLVYSDRWLLNAVSNFGVSPLHESVLHIKICLTVYEYIWNCCLGL
jgi:ankyrin repeat protein